LLLTISPLLADSGAKKIQANPHPLKKMRCRLLRL